MLQGADDHPPLVHPRRGAAHLLPADLGHGRADPGGLDNRHPRDQQAKLDGWARRAQAAHLNAFESFAPFAAAVLVAHVAHADPTWSTYLALAYCALRAIYTLLYVGDLAPARSAVWFAGVAVTVGLFVLPVVKPG